MPLTWMFRGVLHWVLEILIGNYCEQHHFHLDKLSASSWGHSHSEVESRLDLPCVEGGYNKESYMSIIILNSNKNIYDNLTWTVGAQKLSCRLKEKNIIIQFMIKNTTGNHSSSTYETIIWHDLVSFFFLQFKKFKSPDQRSALTKVKKIQILWNSNM